MTPIAFSGDQHIGAMHLTTLGEQEAALLMLVKESVARGCRTVVLCGDATHTLRPTPEVLNVWGRALSLWQKASVKVIAIAGNHEGAAVTSLLSHFRGSITAVTEPRLIQDVDGIDLACLPWLPDRFVRAIGEGALPREEVARRLTAAAGAILRGFVAQKRKGVPMVLATHATIAGAETSTGFNMGAIAGDHYLVPLEELAGFDFVAAAHIHRHQVISDQPNPVVYTGSLLPLDFSETEPKGFIVADPQARGHGYPWEFVPLPTPRVMTIRADNGQMVRDLIGVAGRPIWPEGQQPKVRVRVTCDETVAREFPPSRIEAALRAAGASMVQVELTVERPDRERAGVPADVGPGSAIARYIEEVRGDLSDEQRARILALAAQVVADHEQTDSVRGGDLDLLRIEADNVLGLGHASLEFDGERVTTLTGPNGAGKSSLGTDVLRLALFGASRAGARVDDRVVRTGADLASAAVTLRSSDGRLIRVVRKIKRGSRGASSTLDVLESTGV